MDGSQEMVNDFLLRKQKEGDAMFQRIGASSMKLTNLGKKVKGAGSRRPTGIKSVAPIQQGSQPSTSGGKSGGKAPKPKVTAPKVQKAPAETTPAIEDIPGESNNDSLGVFTFRVLKDGAIQQMNLDMAKFKEESHVRLNYYIKQIKEYKTCIFSSRKSC